MRFVPACAPRAKVCRRGPAGCLVDPRAEVVVGAPGLEVDPAPIDRLAAEPVEHEPDPLPWGRYRVTAIGVPAPASPAAALLALGPEVGDHRDHGATIDALLALLDSVPVTAQDPLSRRSRSA
jgi:hypothetical protein